MADNDTPGATEEVDDRAPEAASGDARAARRAEIEDLFARWDRRDPGTENLADVQLPDGALDEEQDRKFWELEPTTFRLGITLVLVALAGYLMWNTRHEFFYWLSSDQPIDLGNIAEQYKAGQREIDLPDNRYVKVAGLFSTYEATSDEGGGEPGKLANFFICPMHDIVVATDQPFLMKPIREKWGLEVHPGLLPLLTAKKAFPHELVNTFSGAGRLVRAEHVGKRVGGRLVEYYLARTQRPADSLWVFLDGQPPAEFKLDAMVWGLAPILPLVSFMMFMRAWLRRRRAARA